MKYLLCLLLCGCAVKPPDQPLCVDITLSRGHCVWTISNKEQDVDDTHLIEFEGKKYTYWDLRPYMVHVPYWSWVKIKEFILQVCKNNNQCDGISDWQKTVNSIDSSIKEAP